MAGQKRITAVSPLTRLFSLLVLSFKPPSTSSEVDSGESLNLAHQAQSPTTLLQSDPSKEDQRSQGPSPEDIQKCSEKYGSENPSPSQQ